MCGLLVSAPVQAGFVTYNGNVPLQLTELVNAAPTPALPQYNAAAIPGAGALLSATVSYAGLGSTEFSVTNNSAQSQNFSETGQTFFTLDSATPALDALFAPMTSSASGLSGMQSIAANTTSTYGPYSFSTGVVTSPTFTGGDLISFIGNGDLSLFLNSVTGFSLFGGGGNLGAVQTTYALANFSVTYEYADVAAVPEPSTFVLAACGLVGLVGVRYRRRNTAK